MKTVRAFIIILILSLCSAAAAQQALLPPMDNGELDRPDRPFDYFARPTTVLGVLHGPNGFEVTPEGSLYSGYSEIGWFAGPELAPVNQRVKTLKDGYLPVVEIEFSIDGINYRLRYFAVTLDGTPEGELVALARMTASNPGSAPAAAGFGIGACYGQFKPNRIQAHISDVTTEMLKYSFNPKWKYAIRPGAATRSGKIIYTFNEPADGMFVRPGEPYDSSMKTVEAGRNPEDWVAISSWNRDLKPGEVFSVDFSVPYVPSKKDLFPELSALDFEESLAKTSDSWNAWLDNGTRIIVPETKINNTYKANLVYLGIAMDKEGEDYAQKVNEFQYDHFWLRDSAFILTAFGVTGHPFESERGSLYFLKWQRENGNFESQRGQLDGFGQTLWTFGRHYELTRDREYLEKVWPAAWRAIEWLRFARADHKGRLDEGGLGYGLMPISNPGDNENADGHVVGHDIWGLHGLEYMRRAAPDVAGPEQVELLGGEIADYRKWLDYNLSEVTKRTGGFISPAVEPGGFDWANLKLIWPSQVLRPFDMRVTETLNMARYKYKERIMTYAGGEYLHHYIGIDIAQSLLVRGEQTKALHDFYGLVAHTGSTHGGFEWAIKPWGDRDYGKNIAPHGCFAGKWLLLYRNMLVREEGDELHIGSALSPLWLQPGKSVIVENAPTSFGPISFNIRVREDGATVNIIPPKRNPPKNIVLHLPQGFDITAVNADGSVLSRLDFSRVSFSPDTARAEIDWKLRSPAAFTYREAVENYLHVYWQLHEHDRPKGALFDD